MQAEKTGICLPEGGAFEGEMQAGKGHCSGTVEFPLIEPVRSMQAAGQLDRKRGGGGGELHIEQVCPNMSGAPSNRE